MPRYDFKSARLFVDSNIAAGSRIELDRNQANYLISVLRLKSGQEVLIFNGRDGEWAASVEVHGRKKAELVPSKLQREQPKPPNLQLLFAPLKQARLDYMIQKAVEMGVGSLRPAITEFTQVRKVNQDRMRANSIEAAEQCGILDIPAIVPASQLETCLDEVDGETTIIFCDEEANCQNPLTALDGVNNRKIAVLIGPEGGFSQTERENLHKRPNVVAIPLGPRVLRADTAAVAALAIVQSKLGDWQD